MKKITNIKISFHSIHKDFECVTKYNRIDFAYNDNRYYTGFEINQIENFEGCENYFEEDDIEETTKKIISFQLDDLEKILGHLKKEGIKA